MEVLRICISWFWPWPAIYPPHNAQCAHSWQSRKCSTFLIAALCDKVKLQWVRSNHVVVLYFSHICQDLHTPEQKDLQGLLFFSYPNLKPKSLKWHNSEVQSTLVQTRNRENASSAGKLLWPLQMWLQLLPWHPDNSKSCLPSDKEEWEKKWVSLWRFSAAQLTRHISSILSAESQRLTVINMIWFG